MPRKHEYVVIVDDNKIPDVDGTEIQKRCPALILVDCSGSMKSSKKILQDSVQTLYRQIKKDPVSERAVEIGIMSFNDKVTIHRNIQEIYKQDDNGSKIDFVCENETLTGIAVKEALRRIDKRQKDYGKHGIRSYAPVLMIISDGAPFVSDPDDRRAEEEARYEVYNQIHELVSQNKLIVLCVEVGRLCNHEIMQELTGTDNPDRVISHKVGKSIEEEIAEAFSYIARLLVSQSNNGNVFNNTRKGTNTTSNQNKRRTSTGQNRSNRQNNSNKNVNKKSAGKVNTAKDIEDRNKAFWERINNAKTSLFNDDEED